MALPQISFVIPLFNEAESLPSLVSRLDACMSSFPSLSFEVVLIDDGSTDETSGMMQQLSLTNAKYHSVFLARNYGHQIALSAGIQAARGTLALMILDGDLQDPPELFESFYQKLQDGYDVVYSIRNSREERLIRKITYFFFYRLLRAISDIQIPIDSGDFSMISRRVADVLNQMPEESRYIRGMRSWIGFRQIGIAHDRGSRAQGKSKYGFRMLMKLAYNGIFNFSEVPIKFISRLGLLSVCSSLVYFIITIVRKFFYHDVPVGFTALLFSIILFGGVQLISLGVIGEYVVRIFFQVKNRPLFVVSRRIVDKQPFDS
jgi:glycosyltransferase involved in cell wall biosynthesis